MVAQWDEKEYVKHCANGAPTYLYFLCVEA